MMACINKPEMDLFRSRKPAGQIQVIFGPMFSGKTTELMRRVKRYQLANYNCLVIKYSNDTRYHQNGIATHDKQVLPALCTTELSSVLDEAVAHSVIGIDEGQFFPDIVPFCEQMAEKGKIVIVAALDGTYQRKGFGDILNLVPIAESVVKLNAVCVHCYGEASFTKRKGSETALEVIGGPEKYMAVCRSCYKEQVSPVGSPNSKSERYSKTLGSAEKTAVRNHSFGVEITNTMDLSQ